MARYIAKDELIDDFENRMQDDNVMCPIIKVLDVLEIIENTPAADVVPKSEVDKARQCGHESGKLEVVREIRSTLYKEIAEARNSNFEAIKERETKYNVNRYDDMFCRYCDGKIHALDGIVYFVDDFLKKYEEMHK